MPTGDAGFATGNIILGGDGSDIIEGRGGDDLIDGDNGSTCASACAQNVDGTGPEIASFDSMAQMIPLMLNGTYNPGQLVAVREIMVGANGWLRYRGVLRATGRTTRSSSTTTARRSTSATTSSP